MRDRGRGSSSARFVASLLAPACASLLGTACTSNESASVVDADAIAETFADVVTETTTDAGDDADADDVDYPDYGPPRPDAAGWCLSRGGRWGCEKGGACTFDGHCVPPAGATAEAGIKPCGAIGCDPAWCTCINAGASTCDCTP